MKTITLINPPSPWLISDRVMVPLGLLYIASFIRENGTDVNIVDMSGGKDINLETVPKTDLYGVSFVSPQSVYARFFLNILRKEKVLVWHGE